MWQAYAAMAGLQILNGINQSEAMNDQAAMSRQLGELNAKYAELDAFDAEAKGITTAGRYESVINNTVSEQRVIESSKGVDVNFGTAKEVQADTKLTGFLNMLDIKNEAHQKALGFLREANQSRLGGAMAVSQAHSRGDSAITSGYLNAGAIAFSGYTRGMKPDTSSSGGES